VSPTRTLSPDETGPALSPIEIDILTLFPRMFDGPLDHSILRRARDRDLVRLRIHDIRDWTTDRHRTADDKPYGGGPGMVMLAQPIINAAHAVLGDALPETRIVVLSAAGRRFTQSTAWTLSQERRLVLICGHYEGVDERVADILGADQLSIGDYVLTGGEIPAMVVVDAVCRLRPGVIDETSTAEESHGQRLVEYPHYTRPAELQGHRVPAILLKGHHAHITAWRRAKALARTARCRPDLLRDDR
jgi:tRNA (guanine37-N1)-methyltransferase